MYLVQKIVSSYAIVFDEMFSIALVYMLRPYLEALAMRPEVSYILCAKSSHEQTGDITSFAQFEESNLVEK